MPRYEFSEGSSNKFWQIDLSGKSFTTNYGKIGTAGQKTVKTFKTDAEAKKEYDKLIAEKVKKGYEAAEGGDEDEDEDDDEEEAEDEEEEKPAKKTKAAAKPAPKTASKPAAKPAAKAAAKPAKAAAKPAAKSGGSDKSTPRYFEFSEGTSNKFWSVWMEGTCVLTKYGRIGSAGSTTQKEMGSDEKATKEYDKLVNEKTKKGYEEKDAPEGGDDDDDDGDD